MTADHKAAFLFFFRHPVDAISSKHIQFKAGTAKTKSSQYGSYLIFTVLVHRDQNMGQRADLVGTGGFHVRGGICLFFFAPQGCVIESL